MDSDCAALLPLVLKVLADPKQSLPDDTTLEKLVDWFKDQIHHGDGPSFLKQHSCLLKFIPDVCKSKTTEPTILSFTLKLTGLLAANEKDFRLLEERGVLVCVFERGNWGVPGLWDNASVRSGWLHSLQSMLQHQPAMDFICSTGITKEALHLQTDKSLFVVSLADQLLSHILNFHQSPIAHINNEGVAWTEDSNRSDWSSVTTEIAALVVEALASEEHCQVLRGLRVLALTLPQCRAPLRGQLWGQARGPLEGLVNTCSQALLQPIMEVLQAAARTPLLGQSECGIEGLMEAMLCSRHPNHSVQCAALILHLDNCSEGLKRKAMCILLKPLQCLTALPLCTRGTGDAEEVKGQASLFVDQLSKRASCISLVSLCLSSIAELTQVESPFVDVPVRSVTHAVMSLLRICLGQNPSHSPCGRATTHLIGCCRVQRCSLDVLASLSPYDGHEEMMQDVFGVFLEYLQNPDSEATVLKKTLQAILKWICVCSQTPELWELIGSDLFPVLRKRVCDVRWEVRDSSLEFITQLTSHFRGSSPYGDVLFGRGLVTLLLDSLADSQAYVRASAIHAVGQAMTTSHQQGESLNLQEVVTRLEAILAQDTEGFPRRAVIEVSVVWLQNMLPSPDLDRFQRTVLLLGAEDFDWEVKVHTLELAELLMEKLLGHCPYAVGLSRSAERTRLTQALRTLKESGVLSTLSRGLFDCDRPVAQKACGLLLKLKGVIGENSDLDDADLMFEIQVQGWGEEVLQRYLKSHGVRKPYWPEDPGTKREASDRLTADSSLGDSGNNNQDWPEDDPGSESGRAKEMRLAEMLRWLDLEEMQRVLSQSSDHMVNSPRALMEDVLSVAQQTEEHMVDCY